MRPTVRLWALLLLVAGLAPAAGCKHEPTTPSFSPPANDAPDTAWIFPRPSVKRVGTEQVFTTALYRRSDHEPIGSTRVRYRILDGPSAYFLPGKSQDAIVVSDSNGNATVSIAQAAPYAGTNRIAVEVLGAPNPAVPGDPGVVAGQGETSAEWQAATVTVALLGPQTAVVNQELPFTLTLTNASQIEAKFLTVRYPVPETLAPVRSDPPANAVGNDLIWTLAELGAGQSRSLKVVFRTTKVGSAAHQPSVMTDEGRQTDTKLVTAITAPQLEVSKNLPATGAVGVPVNYPITVKNTGSGPATNVVLKADLDDGLVHVSRSKSLERKLGTLAAGESRTEVLVVTPQRTGKLATHIQATADGIAPVIVEHPVEAQDARLEVKVTGPPMRYVGRQADWTIEVVNIGGPTLRQVVLRNTMPRELGFVSATEGGQWSNGVVVWKLGDLEPNRPRVVQLKASCVANAPKVVQTAVATAESGVHAQGEAAMEILGLPALRLDVVDLQDPVPVGGTTTYRIDVENVGTLAADRLEVVATVPAEMQVLSANGPTTGRQDGDKLVFAPLDGVQPKRTLTYMVQVQTLKAASVVFHVELRSAAQQQPLIAEEPTQIYLAPGGARPQPMVPVYPQVPQTREPQKLQPIPER